MHISIRRYEHVTSVREVCSKVATDFVPLLRKSPGFIAYYAIDCGDGIMATISMFSTESLALDSNEIAATWLEANVSDLQPEAPQVTAGRVLVEASP